MVASGNTTAAGSRGRMATLLVAVAVMLALLALLAWGLLIQGRTSESLQGGKAPPFTLSLFDGGQVSSGELRGQVVVVNFWASWCVECSREAALLEEAWRAYRDRGVMFLGIDYVDTTDEALAYMERYGITYPNGPDLGSKISRQYRITGVPETFFIARDGRLAHVKIGPLERPELAGQIEKLLAE
jgi:cytochrome c biogenesis protein CcmG/thiol:disulfide interchange protein DsbE